MINLKLFIPISISPLILTLIYFSTGVPENNIFFITNLLILLFSFCGMFFSPLRFYSLSKMVFIFFFIFLGLVPLINEINGIVFYGDKFNISDKINVNLIILMGLFFFSFGSYYKVNYIDRFVSSLPEIKKLNIFFIIIFISVLLLILWRWNFDLNSLFFRGRSRDILYETQNIFNLKLDTNQFPAIDFHFFTRIIRPMPVLLLLIFYYFYKKKLANFRLLCFLTLSSVILNLPSGIDRSQTAILYIPLLIIFTRIWEKPYMMQATIFSGIFLAFPMLDKFRTFKSWETFDYKIDLNYLRTAHFDSYQNFVRAIEIDFISYGQQLLGALLFFVPRALWSGKPIGSGSELAMQHPDYKFGGISMPYIGEGYVNFGIIGSCLFMLVLGIILGNLDRVAWKLKKSNKDCLFIYYYYLLFGLVFFTMRGDLINSMAFIFATTVTFWGLVLFLKFSERLSFSKN